LHIVKLPKKRYKPCDCGDKFCYGYVLYKGTVQSSGGVGHKKAVDKDGDLVRGNDLDVEVQHVTPCIIIACGRYTLHVRTMSGMHTFFERMPGDPRTWKPWQQGWLYSYSSEDQIGLYRAFVPAKHTHITASSLWFGMQTAKPKLG